MPIFGHKKLDGVIYDLGHLDPVKFAVQCDDREYVVQVQFGCHCFTETFDPAQHKPGLIYQHDGEIRAFSVERHSTSLHLPGLIHSSIGRTVYHTNAGNYFLLRQDIADAHPGPFVAFFDAYKAKKLEGVDVILQVQSAYIKAGMADRASAIRFPTLVKAVANGVKPKMGPLQVIKRK